MGSLIHFLDVGYLRNALRIRCRREGDQVTISWQNSDPSLFTAPPSGEVTVGVPEFLAAVDEFHQAFISAMDLRVAEVVAAPPLGLAVDLVHLHAEQAERPTWLSRAFARKAATDWASIRTAARLSAPRLHGSPTIES